MWPSQALAAFTKPCYSGVNNFHAYIDKTHSGLEINYMRAEVVYLRDPKTCTPNGNGTGSSFVLPVNIQGSGANPSAFVQLGFGRINGGPLGWVYTANEASGGVLVYATSSQASPPVVGHKYRFEVFYAGDVINKWAYEVTDLGGSGGGAWYGDTSSLDWGYKVWSGFEVYDSGDQLGGDGIWSTVNNIGYQVRGSNTTNYLHDRPIITCCGTEQIQWDYYTTDDANGRSFVRALTANT